MNEEEQYAQDLTIAMVQVVIVAMRSITKHEYREKFARHVSVQTAKELRLLLEAEAEAHRD